MWEPRFYAKMLRHGTGYLVSERKERTRELIVLMVFWREIKGPKSFSTLDLSITVRYPGINIESSVIRFNGSRAVSLVGPNGVSGQFRLGKGNKRFRKASSA